MEPARTDSSGRWSCGQQRPDVPDGGKWARAWRLPDSSSSAMQLLTYRRVDGGMRVPWDYSWVRETARADYQAFWRRLIPPAAFGQGVGLVEGAD